VFSKRNLWAFKPAFKAYVEGLDKFNEYIQDLVVVGKRDYDNWKVMPERAKFVPRVYRVKIKVLGCWDTVASLGIKMRGILVDGTSLVSSIMYFVEVYSMFLVSSTPSTRWLWTNIAAHSPPLVASSRRR